MTAADELDAQVYQCAAVILVTGGPSALARF